MVLYVLAFLGGVLALLSPCILPILRLSRKPESGRLAVYKIPSHLKLSQWTLDDKLTDQGQIATLDSARGKIAYRFHPAICISGVQPLAFTFG